jgi:hypothetical protein
MVYKTKFLKKVVENDYDPAADGKITWELSDEALSAVWLTIKGDLVAANMCIDDFCNSITAIDVWFGGFNVMHYSHTIDALMMNCKLKGNAPYIINSSQTIDDVTGVIFPLMFGAPYLNESMALPKSLDNRKKLELTFDIATAALDDLLIDIAEVILPDGRPVGTIKQEESTVNGKGTGDRDLWLQTNWDLLKLLIYSTTAPTGAAYTSTIERAGLEIDDFSFGYQWVPFEILHGELMDELGGQAFGVEDHIHADPSSGNTGMPVGLEHWIYKYAQMDFFFNYDLKWRAPLSVASTAKLKYNAGVDEAFRIVEASYVPASKL